jgi:two-component system sensor histidine kinase KdpD
MRDIVAALRPHAGPADAGGWRGLAGATAVCLAALAAAFLLARVVEEASLVLVFLLGVVLSGALFGRAPALFAAGLSVLLFNLAFVPPRFSLSVADERFVFTLAVMLIVGLVVGQLTAGLKSQARMAQRSEAEVGSLYALSRDLGQALTVERVAEIAERFVRQNVGDGVVIWVHDRSPALRVVAGTASEAASARVARLLAEAPPPGAEAAPGASGVWPLRGTMAVRGAMALGRGDDDPPPGAAQRRLLATCSALVGSALERIHYIAVAQDSAVEIEGERLRSTLLAAISHDLRTPLASLVGLADALQLDPPGLGAQQREIARAMGSTARRMSTMVNNLLDMARLESGAVALNLQWQPVEEVVGSALAAVAPVLERHGLEVAVDEGLPLVRIDAVLMERVLVNLLENAARHTPAGTQVRLAARRAAAPGGPGAAAGLELTVSDDGPGLPAGREEAMFRKFERGRSESATAGVGLGLALCAAVVRAHGGQIAAGTGAAGGAAFRIVLPLGDPPAVPDADPTEPGPAA